MKYKSFAELIRNGVLRVSDGYRAKNNELGGGGPVFLRSAYLQDNGFTLTDPDRFQCVDTSKFGDKVAIFEDTVITTKGNSTGRVGYVSSNVEGAVYSPHLSYWRSLDNNRLCPRYLYFWSRSQNFLDQLHSFAYATDMAPYFSLRDQMRIVIALPNIAIQREIAAILSALDDKIELNRKTAATLEEMARALYRSWFVDFDPVHAKAAGLAPAHMDAPTAALFPDRFGDYGLPERWEEKPLSSIADFLNGAALQKFPPLEGEVGIPVIKIAQLRNGLTAGGPKASSELPMKYKVHDGDVLFSWSGSLLQRVWTGGMGALNQHLFKVSSEVVPKWFHYFAVDQHMMEFQAIAASKATTMGHIQRHHLDEAQIIMPTQSVMASADRLIQPLFNRSFQCQMENHSLVTLRDTLLPRLMSGELRVGEARAQVEEVV